MALDLDSGRKALQLLTSRYDNRHWRRKIEKTLGLPATGVGDEVQRAIFQYLRHGLKAYKSHRADPDSWIVGGYATKEVIDRAKFDPTVVGPAITKEDVGYLGEDPGTDVDETWWEDMLVQWFDEPDAEPPHQDEGEAEAEEQKDDTAPAPGTEKSDVIT